MKCVWLLSKHMVMLMGVWLVCTIPNASGQTYTNNFDYPVCKKDVFQLTSSSGVGFGVPDGFVLNRRVCEPAPGEFFCGPGAPAGLGKISFSLSENGPYTSVLDYRGFIKSSGSILSTDPFRIKIQPSKMKVDGLDISRFIAKATTADFHSLDAAIHTLRGPIARL